MPVEDQVRDAVEHGDVQIAATVALRAHGPEVLGYLSALLKNDADAADVFSQFAEDLWRGLPQFRWECSLRAWAYRVAFHAAARYKRDPYQQRKRRLETTAFSKIADEVRMSSVIRQDRRQQEIARLREALDPDEQTLLILRLDRGLSWKDVAHVLPEQGEPPAEAALRKRFERIKEKLAKKAKEAGLLE
jgi:RNA polymerase sigma-70 factor, ECF subfamily